MATYAMYFATLATVKLAVTFQILSRCSWTKSSDLDIQH